MKKILFLIIFIIPIWFSLDTQAQTYLLIVSSKPSKAMAENEVELLQASGFINAGMLYHESSKRYRVYLNVFESKERAEEEAEIYRDIYKDSWVLKSKSIALPIDESNDESNDELKEESNDESETTTGITQKVIDEIRGDLYRTNSKYDLIQKDLLETKKSNSEIKKDILQIKDEVAKLSDLLTDFKSSNAESSVVIDEKIKNLEEYIKRLEAVNQNKEKEIKDLDKNLEKIRNSYVKTSDTVSISWKLVRKKFDFGKPKISIGLGVVQSNLFSNITSFTQSYYKINLDSITKSFWGINLSCGYHFTPKWIAELSLKSYLNSNNLYLFPSVAIKYSQQLGRLPLNISPSLGVGTEALFLKNNPLKGARYIFYSPGLELEYGFSKKISIFAKCNYNFISHSENNKFQFDKTRELDLVYGIHFNF